jgi:hypothetical protein
MRRFIQTIRLATASVVAFSALLTVGITGIAHAATSLYWCEPVSSDHKFSTAANWNTAADCSSGTNQAPAGGEDLVFDSANITTATSLNNDVSNLSVESMTFTGNTNSYTITGNAMTLTGAAAGLTQSGTNLPHLNVALTLTGSQTFTTGAEMSLGGALSGSGNITMAGSGTLDLVTSPSYSGTLTDATGIVSLSNTSGTFAFGTITVTSGGALTLTNTATGDATFTFPLNLGGTGSGSIKALNVSQTSGGTSVLAGTTTLTSNVLVDGVGTLNITGPLAGAFTIGVDTGQSLTLNINSSNNTSNTPNTVTAGDTSGADGGSAPGTPDTGFARVAAHPVVTLLATVTSAAVIFGIARFTRKSTGRR